MRFEMMSVPGTEKPWILRDYVMCKDYSFATYDEARAKKHELMNKASAQQVEKRTAKKAR